MSGYETHLRVDIVCDDDLADHIYTLDMDGCRLVRVETVQTGTENILDEVEARVNTPAWTSPDEPPDTDRAVLLACETRYTNGRPAHRYVIRASYARQYEMPVGSEDFSDDWAEYKEEHDEWYCPEGWYETNDNEVTHWAVSSWPIGWQEMPSTDTIPKAA